MTIPPSSIYSQMGEFGSGRTHPPRVATPESASTPVAERLITWLLMLSMVFLAVRGNFSFEAGNDSSVAGGGSLSGLVSNRQMGLVGYVLIPGVAYSIIAWQIIRHHQKVLSLAMQMKLFTLLAFTTILSAAWSQAPLRSVYNGAFYLLATLFAFYLVTTFSAEEIMDMVMLLGTIICLLDLAMVIFVPKFGVSASEGRTAGAWRGLFVFRTGTSTCLTYLITPALVFGYRRLTLLRVAYIGLVFTSIVMAKSVTALFMVVIYTAFMAGLALVRRLERRTAFAICLFLVPLCGLAAYLIFSNLAELLAAVGRDPTLTGRTDIWASLMPSIHKSPLLGYGYYAFWQRLTGESARVLVTAHWIFGYAHDGYLEIVLQLGLVGLAMFLLTFAGGFKNAFKVLQLKPSMGVEWYVGLLVLTIFINIDEETIVIPNDLLSIIYIVACCGLFLAKQDVLNLDPYKRTNNGITRVSSGVH